MNLLLPTIEPRLPKRVPKNLILGWRLCQPDLRSTRGYRWPLPGGWAEAEGPFTNGPACPENVGDGICIAKTWRGATSGGCRSHTALLVAYKPSDVLGSDSTKVRVKRALVLDIFHTLDTLGPGANLTGANLTGADLTGAYLTGANLTGANLTGADLTGAHVSRANLTGANLTGADLTGAHVSRADLTGAYLTGANLTGAYVGSSAAIAEKVRPLGWVVTNGYVERAK